MRKKRVLKRNDYRINGLGWSVRMPSLATISIRPKGGVNIHYPDGSRRWLSDTWYDNINTDEL